MSIFREYDIRGIFGEDLNKNVVVKIGAELGREITARAGKSVGIGYDARKHSPILFKWLCEGLSGNSSLGMQFRTCEKFWESTDSSLVLSQNFSQIQKPHRKYFDFDSQSESPTNQTQNIDSTLDSAQSAESIKNQSARSANLLKALSGVGEGVVREGEGSDFAIQAPTPSLKENARGQKWDSNADLSDELHKKRDSSESQKTNAPLQIYDLGMIPTPCAYFSLYMQNGVDSSIMITGSHNPPKYNGFKITILKKPFYGEDIRKLGERITQNMGDSHDSNNNAPISSLRDSAQRAESWQSVGFVSEAKQSSTESTAQNQQIQKLNALQSYIDFLTSHFAKLKNFPHKVAFDCGNGVAGIALKSVLKNLNIPYLPLFFEPNGDFPNHHPDPSEDKNLVFLRNAMKENNIKIGIAFDGDADRIGLLTQNYHFKGDELAILFAKQIATGAKPIKPVVIGEVKCSAIMYSEINKFGSAIMHKTGHSNLKVKLAETNAHLAAEMSGHIFFNDRYFGYDDAIYASLRALELFLDSSVESIEHFIKSLPQMFSTSEEKIESSEDKKFEIIKKLAKKLNEIRQNQSANQSGGDSQNTQQNPQDSQNAPQDFPKIVDIIDIDGIRVVFENGWGLIRASNTTPVLVTRFEGENRECAELYKAKMLSLLSECLSECEGEL